MMPWVPWGRSPLSIREPHDRKPQVSVTAQDEALLHLWEAGLGPYHTGWRNRWGRGHVSLKKCLIDCSISLIIIISNTSIYKTDGFLLLAHLTLLLCPLLGKVLGKLGHRIQESEKAALSPPSPFLWLPTPTLSEHTDTPAEGAFSF